VTTARRDGAVELWRQEDGAWRWRWVSADGRTTLVSHRAFDAAEEAVESARAAYPDAAVPDPEDAAKPRHRLGRRVAGVVVRAGVVAGVVVGVLAAVVVRRRHSSANRTS